MASEPHFILDQEMLKTEEAGAAGSSQPRLLCCNMALAPEHPAFSFFGPQCFLWQQDTSRGPPGRPQPSLYPTPMGSLLQSLGRRSLPKLSSLLGWDSLLFTKYYGLP